MRVKRILIILAALLICLSLTVTSFSATRIAVFGDQGQNLIPLEWMADEAKEKGIEIEVVGVPFTAVYEKLKTEFIGGTGAYDVVIFYPSYLGEFADFGYLMPLDPFFEEIDPHIDDVVPAYKELYCEYAGKTYALPYDGDVLNFYFRKDVFSNDEEKANFKAKYGYELEVPKTWDKLVNVAEFFTRAKGEKLAGKVLDQDFYGFAFLGARGFAYAWWSSIFASYGGAYFDRDMNPQINSDAGVEALEYLKSIMQYCPPDVLSYGYVELKDAFLLNRVSTMVQWSDIWKKAQNPKESKIVGLAGISEMPGVLRKDGSIYYRASAPVGRVISIPSTTKHPKEAYWVAWMLSDKLSTRGVSSTETGLDPYRYSHVNNASAFKDFAPESEAKEYLEIVMNNLNHLFPDLNIPGAGQYLDILDIAVTSALAGSKTPQKALDEAAEEWNEITNLLDRERQKKIYNNMLETWKKFGFWED